jgi:hypothetical protein
MVLNGVDMVALNGVCRLMILIEQCPGCVG